MSTEHVIKRPGISIKQRMEIVEKLEKGTSVVQIANDYGISMVTVRRIRRNSDQVREAIQKENVLDRKRLRVSKYADIDERLYEWFKEQRALGQITTEGLLREKALEITRELGGPSTFMVSKGWIWRFKNRHGIRLVEVQENEEEIKAGNKENKENKKSEEIKMEDIKAEPTLQQPDIDYEELERSFQNIIQWAETQNDLVKLHAQILKYFYDTR